MGTQQGRLSLQTIAKSRATRRMASKVFESGFGGVASDFSLNGLNTAITEELTKSVKALSTLYKQLKEGISTVRNFSKITNFMLLEFLWDNPSFLGQYHQHDNP